MTILREFRDLEEATTELDDDGWGDPEQAEKMMRGQWPNLEEYQCPRCESNRLRKDGFQHKKQRYCCRDCGSPTILPLGLRKNGKK